MDAREWDLRYTGSEFLWKAEPNQFLVDEVAGLQPGRALDLGAGEGRNAVWLAEEGWEVTGVDFSDVGLAKAARLADSRAVEVEWVRADLRTYAPPQDTFDLVIVFYIHLPHADLEGIIQRAFLGLRSGGTLLVVGHDRSNPTEGYGGPQDPEILYSPDMIAGWVPDAVVERAERVTRQVTTEDGPREAVDTLIRARRP